MTRRSKYTPAANGSKWIKPSTRWAIYYRDDFACVYCTEIPTQLTLDHVKNVECGGSNDPSNLVTCCLGCNSRKQSLSMRQWFRRLRGMGYHNTEPIRRRIARLVKKPLDRERGRFLASTRERYEEGYANGIRKVQPLLEADKRRDSNG